MHNIVLSAHVHDWLAGLVYVGKGRQHHMSIMQMQGTRRVCGLRALVFNIQSTQNNHMVDVHIVCMHIDL